MAIEDTRKRWLALYALRLASLMIVFDMTIVRVALPSIKRTSVSRTPRWHGS